MNKMLLRTFFKIKWCSIIAK